VSSSLVARGLRDAAILSERPRLEPADPLSEIRRLAEEGDADAQNRLGDAYSKGEGVPQDHAESAKWHSKAAEQGRAEAQYSLGVQYFAGEGVPNDWSEAAKWFARSAEQGNAESQFYLGYIYHHSEGSQHHDYRTFFRAPTRCTS